MVVLKALSKGLLAHLQAFGVVDNSRFGDHVSLEEHFIQLPFAIDECLLRIWQV